MFSGIQKHHGGTTMTELDKAANEYANSIAQHDHNKVFSIYDFKAGAEWQYEKFEKERLKHCDELTAEQAQIESDFVVQHLEKYNRTPTFIDAIEYGSEAMREKVISRLESLCNEWHLHESTEAKYRREVYSELINELKEE